MPISKIRRKNSPHELASQVHTLDNVNGLMRSLMKSTLERMLNTEMDVRVPVGDSQGDLHDERD